MYSSILAIVAGNFLVEQWISVSNPEKTYDMLHNIHQIQQRRAHLTGRSPHPRGTGTRPSRSRSSSWLGGSVRRSTPAHCRRLCRTVALFFSHLINVCFGFKHSDRIRTFGSEPRRRRWCLSVSSTAELPVLYFLSGAKQQLSVTAWSHRPLPAEYGTYLWAAVQASETVR